MRLNGTVVVALDHFLHTGGGTWMSLAGFSGALADKGGPYRTRAITLAVLTLAGAQICGVTRFLDSALLARFGVPAALPR